MANENKHCNDKSTNKYNKKVLDLVSNPQPSSQQLICHALTSLPVSAGSPDVPRCYDCFTSTASSACHVRPANEPNGKAVCPRGTKRCVTERHQTNDGNLISLRRRCATELESRFSYNR